MLAFTEVHVKSQEFPVETPFVLALVRLNEGPRLLGVLTPRAGTLGSSEFKPGMKIRVTFKQLEQPQGEVPPRKWPRIFFESD